MLHLVTSETSGVKVREGKVTIQFHLHGELTYLFLFSCHSLQEQPLLYVPLHDKYFQFILTNSIEIYFIMMIKTVLFYTIYLKYQGTSYNHLVLYHSSESLQITTYMLDKTCILDSRRQRGVEKKCQYIGVSTLQ